VLLEGIANVEVNGQAGRKRVMRGQRQWERRRLQRGVGSYTASVPTCGLTLRSTGRRPA
jgi:hypothetical protein